MSSQIPASAMSLSGSVFSLPRRGVMIALIAALAASCDSHASITDQFVRLTTYPSGGSPATTVSADFNRDGKLDVVVLNTNGVLSLLPGSGNGALGTPQIIATLPAFTGATPLLKAADFNGDGDPDLVILQSPGNTVQAFLGHGDGTFAAPVTIADGLSAAGSLVTGDFNGDGKADIAVTSGTSIAVLLGSSGGIFANPTVTVTNLTASGSLLLALGDVNRDSHLDALVSDGRNVQVLLGNGTGALNRMPVVLPSYIVATGECPSKSRSCTARETAIADINGDGNPDLVLAFPGTDVPRYTEFNFARPCIYFGYGDGTFNLNPTCYSPRTLSLAGMQVTDLNGRAGLVFAGDPVILLNNDGSGALSQTYYAAGGGTVTLGDFNGDGSQDIAVSNDGGVQVLLNAGSGVLRAPVSLSRIGGPFNETLAMNTTDFNYDGFADLALTEIFNDKLIGILSPSAAIVLSASGNKFNTTANVGLEFSGSSPLRVNPPAIGDFNHDGHLDIAYSGSQESLTFAQILFGDGKGGFPTQGPALSLSTNFLAATYFNSDGYADLASLDGSSFEILLGNGDGTFAAPVSYPVGANPVFVLQRDMNSDGKRDVVVVNHDSNDISVLLGNGNGTFQPQKRFAAGTAPFTAVTGDFNRDGIVDIAVGGSDGVSVLLGKGDGTFQAQKTYAAGGPVTGLVQASVRQDGFECLIAIDSASNRFALLPGNGDGTFGAPVFFPVDRVPTAIVGADFNHDGAPDIVLMGNGSLAVFLNQGGDQVTLSTSSAAPKTGQSVTFTARVTAGFGELGAPTGKVTFKDGAKYLGNIPVHAGTASIKTHLTAGTHRILALYGGDSRFNPNHSATLSIAVAP